MNVGLCKSEAPLEWALGALLGFSHPGILKAKLGWGIY